MNPEPQLPIDPTASVLEGRIPGRLLHIVRSPRHSPEVKKRARRLLQHVLDPESTEQVPEIESFLHRYLEQEVDGLRPPRKRGRPPALNAEQERELLYVMLQAVPPRRNRWTSRALAARAGLSQPTVVRFWQRYDMKPHQSPLIRVQPTASAPRRARLVGLFLSPPHRIAAISDDNGPQSADRSFEGAPPRARTGKGLRHGDRPLLEAVDTALASPASLDLPRLRTFLDNLLTSSRAARPSALVVDGLSVAEASLVQKWAEGVEVLATPSTAVWFELTEQYLDPRSSETPGLEAAARDFLGQPEPKDRPSRFMWRA